MNYAILAAGGQGIRFGSSKQFFPLHGKALFLWSVEAFRSAKEIDRIILVYPPDGSETEYEKVAPDLQYVKGGQTRFESVRNGFQSIGKAHSDDVILIHDVARPIVSAHLLQSVLNATANFGAVVPAVRVRDTAKVVQSERIVRTMPREDLWLAQTPQGFLYDVLQRAYQKAAMISPDLITDESLLAERAGISVSIIPGERSNIKITDPEDVKLAEFFLNQREE